MTARPQRIVLVLTHTIPLSALISANAVQPCTLVSALAVQLSALISANAVQPGTLVLTRMVPLSAWFQPMQPSPTLLGPLRYIRHHFRWQWHSKPFGSASATHERYWDSGRSARLLPLYGRQRACFRPDPLG